MSVSEWSDTYGIHHWQTLSNSYGKLALVGFEPTTTEFCSDALTDWAIRPWVQLFEVAIDTWPDWDLNTGPLILVQTL